MTDAGWIESRIKHLHLENLKMKRAHRNFRATVHEQLIIVEHYWEHQFPGCKTCDGARRVLRELIVATRPA